MDYRFTTQDDVLCAVNLGSAGDFVSCVLLFDVRLGFFWVQRFGVNEGGSMEGGSTVSIYSPFAAFGGGISRRIRGVPDVRYCNCGVGVITDGAQPQDSRCGSIFPRRWKLVAMIFSQLIASFCFSI